MTSHTWENGKNELSHQDPTLCEALMGEMSDFSRVVFPADWNTAIASLRAVYSTHGQIWTLVIPKRTLPIRFTDKQALEMIASGAVRLRRVGGKKSGLILVAIGGYQLSEVIRASDRLADHSISHDVIYMFEPGRFRRPRDSFEAKSAVPAKVTNDLFPDSAMNRVFLAHMRPESLLGVIRPLDTGPDNTSALGFINRGGTLDAAGMLFANRSTWAHVLAEVSKVTGISISEILSEREIMAVQGKINPSAAMI
jgi:phosphoketolase